MTAIYYEPFTPRTTGAIREVTPQNVMVGPQLLQRIRFQFDKASFNYVTEGKPHFITWIKESGPYFEVSNPDKAHIDLYTKNGDVILCGLEMKEIRVDRQFESRGLFMVDPARLTKSDQF